MPPQATRKLIFSPWILIVKPTVVGVHVSSNSEPNSCEMLLACLGVTTN